MDPYLWTWLARWGGACALVVAWTLAAAHQATQRRWAMSGGFAALAAVSGIALATHLVPLVRGDALPDDAWALDLTHDAPYVVLAALACLGRPLRDRMRFDLLTVLPLALWSHGAVAWVFAIVLIGRGWLAVGQVRSWLLAGMFLLATATAGDAHRVGLRNVAQDQGISNDSAIHLVSAVTSGLEAVGWVAITGWTARRSTFSQGDVEDEVDAPTPR